MGAFTLLDEHTMIAASETASPFPGGVVEFAEDKVGPPSRAYLKLWEALTRARKWPEPGDLCFDAGAAPGGWTWALARLGARVTACDRAPLDERIAAMKGVSFTKHDAFTLRPEDVVSLCRSNYGGSGPLDWLFCDVICYPSRLYEWIEKWLAAISTGGGLCRNFVCTIKMQGGATSSGAASSGITEADFETPRLFAAIPGSQVVHLYHNKHELTWLKVSP
jgi:23S rRNA (cytidine2498-2'-O)-methyltransferase